MALHVVPRVQLPVASDMTRSVPAWRPAKALQVTLFNKFNGWTGRGRSPPSKVVRLSVAYSLQRAGDILLWSWVLFRTLRVLLRATALKLVHLRRQSQDFRVWMREKSGAMQTGLIADIPPPVHSRTSGKEEILRCLQGAQKTGEAQNSDKPRR